MPHDIVLTFWFEELQPAQWWRVDAALDQRIRTQFGALHQAAHAGELAAWRDQPDGRLAEIIVLDQFSRNIHRGTPLAFACDPMALALAQEAVRAGADRALPVERRAFLYMPYMHSESARIHQDAERLFRTQAPQANHQAELQHKAIIDRFGRYPHRNAILGRASSAEELAFLQQPGSSF
jgi:uncharacterized protein (DUF924 family)